MKIRKKRLRNFSILSIFLCVVIACTPSQKRIIYNDLKQILLSEILLSIDMPGTDGSSFREKTAEKDFKIIHYIDSTSCNECSLKSLHYWQGIMEDTAFSNVGFFFIVWSDSFEDTRRALSNIKFKHTVYLDMHGYFGWENKYLKNNLYNTILINRDNQVVLVGDLLGNTRLMEKYREMIERNEALSSPL